MPHKNNRPEKAAELRKRAEKIAKENTALSTEDIDTLSIEETRKMLHELRIHQIELEMQNEEPRRSQEELDTARAKYFDLYNLAPVGYITLSEMGLILETNLTAATLIGVPRGSIVKQPISRFILKEDQAIYYLHRKKLFQTGKPQECELRLVKPDSAFFWARLIATTAQGEDGAPVCRVVLRDITERKRAEEALRASEGHLRSTLDGLSALIAVLDERGEIILVNKAYRDFGERNGVDPTAVSEGANYLAVCDTASGDYSEEATPFAEGIREVLSGKLPYFELEYPCHSPDEKRWFFGRVTPIQGEEPRRVVVAHENITARKQAEAKLADSESLHRTTIENISDTVLITDDQGTFTYICPNTHYIFGWTPQEVAALGNISALFGAAIFDHDDLIRKGEISNIESAIWDSHGQERFLLVNVKRVSIKKGTILYTCRDITDRKWAEEGLRKSQEQLREAHRLAQIGIWNWIADTDTVTWAEELYHIAGLDPMMPAPTYAEHHNLYAPESWARLKEAAEKVLETGAPYQLELELIRPDGTIRWVNAFGGAIYGDHGRVEGLHGTVQDITERKRMEEALKEITQRLQIAASSAGLGIWDWDLTSNKMVWDDRMLELYGITSETFPGGIEAWQNGLHPEDRDKTIEECQASLRGEKEWDTDFRVLHPDGTIKHIKANGMVVRDSAGSPVRMLGVNFDVTERKLAEEALRESEERFRTLATLAPAGIYITTPEGHCQYANPRWCEMAGLSLEEAFGDGWIKGLHPEDRASTFNNWQQMVASRGHWGLEYRFQTPTGKVTWVYGLATPQHDAFGNIIGYVGINTDITERKLAEEALIDSQNNLKSFFNAIPESVFLMDINGTVLAVNATTVNRLGKPPHEILGKSIYDFIPDRVGDYRKQVVEKVIQTKKPATFEDERLGRYFYNNISPVLNELGRVVRLAVVGIDITERKQNEERLKQAQKLESIGTLAGGIAHDFNNILYPLLGFAELLKEDIPPDSPLQEHIDEILQATLRSKDLVKQILAFSRKSDQKTKPFHLHPIIKEALKLLRSSIPSTIDIQQDIDSGCGFIMADPTQIHQIVMNLATNAYHAMEDTGGRLKVSLKQIQLSSESDPSVLQALTPGNYALLTVSDTGTGIEKSILDKIFDPYFTTKGVGKGTGLGLSVVHGIVKTYKGEILIHSTPGKGTEVHVYLPIMEQAVEKKGISNSEPLPGGTERILLVDDETPIIRVERYMLEKQGYQVTSSMSSLEALTIFKADPTAFDLMLTDMTMPNMTGIQLSEKLISIRPDIPIILCTGYNEKITEEKAKAIGIKGFLMKPVDKSDMAKMVRKVLDEAKG